MLTHKSLSLQAKLYGTYFNRGVMDIKFAQRDTVVKDGYSEYIQLSQNNNNIVLGREQLNEFIELIKIMDKEFSIAKEALSEKGGE